MKKWQHALGMFLNHPLLVCDALSAPPVSETRRSVPHHGQHSDERPELPLSRHLHHPPVPDESVSSDPAGTNQFINYIRNKPQQRVQL